MTKGNAKSVAACSVIRDRRIEGGTRKQKKVGRNTGRTHIEEGLVAESDIKNKTKGGGGGGGEGCGEGDGSGVGGGGGGGGSMGGRARRGGGGRRGKGSQMGAPFRVKKAPS